MLSGLLISMGYIFYPIIVFFLMKKYLEEKNKSNILLYNKSIVEYEDFLKKKYLLRPLKSLQIGLLSFFIGLGVFIGAYYRYTKMSSLLSTLWPSEEPIAKFTIHGESYNFAQNITYAIVFMAFGISLVIYYFIASTQYKKLVQS